MRKKIVAVTVGLLLVAGQAAAAAGSNTAVARVGDRLGGARTTAQVEVGSGGFLGGIPIGAAIVGGLVVVGAIAVAADDGETD